MEQQLKLQRAVHQQRKLGGTSEVTRSVTPVKGQVIGSRRVIVKNPDGTTRIIQQAVTQVSRTATTTPNTPATATASSTVNNMSSTQSTSSTPTPHKVQIIRGPDGKVSVRGLNPGQQLVQMPDGKLHVLTTTTTSNVAAQGSHQAGFYTVITSSNVSTDYCKSILQGLVGNDFTAQQLQLVQTQVKQQLMKAQESNGKLGVLGPTKIYLAVQPETSVQSQPPPLTPVHQSATHQQVGGGVSIPFVANSNYMLNEMKEEVFDDEFIVVCSPPNQIEPTSQNEVTQDQQRRQRLDCASNLRSQPNY
ncbi:hypothetical protein M5D96_007670 [Drosophila gunungcola]|uniref:Uncharacterized protein n=1 Tax=Drosophila gunungcola TaxID=103775 RepID=A0A9Q0BPC3_9MUSC|nr:hypothetical protein M5D96_007670 [Drosophila gunungcola]